jgi:4-hydroxybenzoate polyprenyltransferase
MLGMDVSGMDVSCLERFFLVNEGFTILENKRLLQQRSQGIPQSIPSVLIVVLIVVVAVFFVVVLVILFTILLLKENKTIPLCIGLFLNIYLFLCEKRIMWRWKPKTCFVFFVAGRLIGT